MSPTSMGRANLPDSSHWEPVNFVESGEVEHCANQIGTLTKRLNDMRSGRSPSAIPECSVEIKPLPHQPRCEPGLRLRQPGRPATAATSLTMPSIGALRICSIFIASIRAMRAPFFTAWPGSTNTATTLPFIGARIATRQSRWKEKTLVLSV